MFLVTSTRGRTRDLAMNEAIRDTEDVANPMAGGTSLFGPAKTEFAVREFSLPLRLDHSSQQTIPLTTMVNYFVGPGPRARWLLLIRSAPPPVGSLQM